MTGTHPAESPTQAATWDRTKANAVRFGLCELCAAQLAWAHQSHAGSFASAHPPCDECAPLLATLPVAKANGWRTVAGGAHSLSNWPSNGMARTPGADTPAGTPSRLLRRSATVDETLREREGGV